MISHRSVCRQPLDCRTNERRNVATAQSLTTCFFSPSLKMFFLLVLIALLQIVCAQSESDDNSSDSELPPELVPSDPKANDFSDELDYIGYVSSDEPLNTVFYKTANSSVRESYEWLLDFAYYIDNLTIVAAAISENLTERERIDTHNERLAVCNANNDPWKERMIAYFPIRGWGEIDDGCMTNVVGTDEEIFPDLNDSDYQIPSLKEAYEKVTQHSRYINYLASQAAQKAFQDKDTNYGWDEEEEEEEAFRGTGYAYHTTNQECLLDYAGFVKRNAVWYVAERITNRKRRFVAQSMQRLYLYEYIHPNKSSLSMILKDNSTGNYRRDATTAIYLSGGFERPSAFGDLVAAENLAIERAIIRGEHSAEQADDATTTSNIAILALPLLMNLVPVALIADVNTIGILLYTLLTDVLTAVPLAIKGVEVLQIGLRLTYATHSRITGATLGVENKTELDDDKVLEVWVAECQAETKLRTTGVILLVIALTAMVGGIIAEFIAKRWTLRKGAGKVIEDPWTGTDVPLVDVMGSDQEPVSSTTTVAPPLGSTSAALLLASNAALRERESAIAAASESSRLDDAHGGPNNTLSTSASTSANVAPITAPQQRVGDSASHASAAYPRPVRPSPSTAPGESDQNREKKA